MDAFQGCYKDGTNGTYDCRYFAASYIILRVVGFLAYAWTHSVYFWIMFGILLTAVVVVIVTVKPYKSSIYNTVDVLLFLSLVMVCFSMMALGTSDHQTHRFLHLTFVLAFSFALLPLGYISIVLFHWLLVKKKVPQVILQRLCIQTNHLLRYREMEESLPDRLVHPQEYESQTLLAGPVEGDYYGTISREQNLSENIICDTY